MSITQILNKLGMSHHQRGSTPEHHVTRKGKTLFTGTGEGIVAWLKSTGQWPTDPKWFEEARPA
jgi:hypothetical protein